MSFTISAFLGSWTVQWVSGQKPFLKSQWTILIGTDTQGDTLPSFTGEYAVCVGFTVLDSGGNVMLSTTPQPSEEPPHQPLVLLFDGSSLRWDGYYDQQPLNIYISLSTTKTTGPSYVSLYGSTTWGDPDQVAVWGTDARPPGG
jgi:hypothetical protein